MEELLEFQVVDDIMNWAQSFFDQNPFLINQEMIEAYWKEKLDDQTTSEST